MVSIKQIVAAQWTDARGGEQFSLFALGDDGQVYRHVRALGGWKSMGHRLIGEDELRTHYAQQARRRRGEGSDG